MYSRRQILAAGGVSLVTGAAATAAWDGKTSSVTRSFHRQYYDTGVWFKKTSWMGAKVLKNPMDLWSFQEIIHETRPDVILETGTYQGGSAYYFATLFDLIGKGRICTMDIEDMPGKPQHPRVSFRKDSSTSEDTMNWLRSQIQPGDKVMVTLDSLHTKEHVLDELGLYAPLVTPGCYLVVEDTHVRNPIDVSGDESLRGHDGPFEAVEAWLPKHAEFERDASREKFLLTFNPGGWLRRTT